MPIDQGMGYEAVYFWLGAFIAAERLSASHPLRQAALDAAEVPVVESYRQLTMTENIDTRWTDETDRVACEDVIAILHGAAQLLVANLDDETLDKLDGELESSAGVEVWQCPLCSTTSAGAESDPKWEARKRDHLERCEAQTVARALGLPDGAS